MKQLFLYFSCLYVQMAIAMPSQIILIRHAEKDPDSAQLVNPQGLERAAALAYYLTELTYLQNAGPIKAIFASRQADQSDRVIPRTIETAMPVAELLQLPVHSPFSGAQTSQMVDFIMNSPQYDGQNILLVWNHSSIIDLLHAFGYEWPINTVYYPSCHFDYTFVLTFPQTSSYPKLYFQQLLYGDSTCCTGGCMPLCNPGVCPNTQCTPPHDDDACDPYTPPPTCNPCAE